MKGSNESCQKSGGCKGTDCSCEAFSAAPSNIRRFECPNGCEIEYGLVCGGPPEEDSVPNGYFRMSLDGHYENVLEDGTEGVPKEFYDHADGGCCNEPVCPECQEELTLIDPDQERRKVIVIMDFSTKKEDNMHGEKLFSLFRNGLGGEVHDIAIFELGEDESLAEKLQYIKTYPQDPLLRDAMFPDRLDDLAYKLANIDNADLVTDEERREVLQRLENWSDVVKSLLYGSASE